MEKQDISTIEDVELLVRSFYMKVLSNDDLSFFFSHAIQDWDDHIKRFINYWSHQILFTDSYLGSALHGHEKIDARYNHSFRDHHFKTWQRLFEETVDKHFQGSKAELAKEIASNMAANMYKKMYIGRRPKGHIPRPA